MKQPLIFQFIEKPSDADLDFSNLEYDSDLNLNILRNTGKPAVSTLIKGTRNNVRDRDLMDVMMETQTRTFTQRESSDSDRPFLYSSELQTLITMTHTKNMIEGSDSDA